MLALLVALVLLVLLMAGGAVWLASTMAVHEDAASAGSIAHAYSRRHAASIEDSRRIARSVIARDELPGLSVAVAVGGEVVWAEGFGWADVESETKITPLTRFRLGALSKPLTAVAAALLHDRGRLALDAPVQRYVPAYPQKQWSVTTRQLMGDVAGVHRIRGDNNDAMPGERCTSLDEGVALFARDPLLFEPGTQHRYSIYGWVLVSAAVEGAAGERFSRFMARQVFEPLGMNRTIVAETEGAEGVPSSPKSMFGVRVGRERSRPDYSCLAGAGAFLSTPTDLVRLGSAMLKPGLLTPQTIALFQTPTRLASGASTTYALGWTVGTVQLADGSTRIVSHRGSPMGGSVSLLTFPDHGLAVAAAANASNARGVNELGLQVADAFARRSKGL